MSTRIKNEKLVFAADEMRLALNIAEQAADDFIARAVARHVLVRARDFSVIAFDLVSELRRSGSAVDVVRGLVQTYSTTFDAHFKETRTKLAAHVQDLEFSERLELWADIDAESLGYFADGAREICLGLAALQGNDVSSLRDLALLPRLDDERGQGAPDDTSARLGTDVLAMSRPNTVSVLNMTPVHQRAGEIVALRRWLQGQWNLLRRADGRPEAARLLKARIVTDVVSLADCLVTRADGDPANRIAGLDELLRSCNGGDPSAIDEFKAAYHFDRDLAPLREVRNHVGAHLEQSDALDLATALRELDALSLAAVAALTDRMLAIFRMTCRRTFFLETHLTDGVALVGVRGDRLTDTRDYRPFATATPTPAPIEWRSVQPNLTMDVALRRWIANGAQDVEAKGWLWDAFMPKTLLVVDGVGVPQLTPAHDALLHGLVNAASEREARALLSLIEHCARGYPDELALVLVKCYEATAACTKGCVPQLPFLRALGALPLSRGEWARLPLREGLSSRDPLVATQARLSLYAHALVDPELATNEDCTVFTRELSPSLASAPAQDRLLPLLALASRLKNAPPASRLDQASMEAEGAAVLDLLRAAADEVLGEGSSGDGAGKLILSGDLVGLTLVAVRHLGAQTPSVRPYLQACAEGLIVPASHPEIKMGSLCNLARAFLLLGDSRAAVRIAWHVMGEDPLALPLHLVLLPLLVEAGVPRERVQGQLDDLLAACVMRPELEPLASRARAACEARGATT